MNRRQKRFVTVAVVAAAGAACLAGFTGPEDMALYPASGDSPYRLPFETGTTRWCVQGNRGVSTHRGRHEYAFDFVMPLGTPVVAARGGVVVEARDSRRGTGNFAGNSITIEHLDGTRAFYAHLEYGGSRVSVGDTVARGQVIGTSGSTGRSIYPHVHFQVERDSMSIPVSFFGLSRHRGVPRAGFRYEARDIVE